jgi:hypothetical protein
LPSRSPIRRSSNIAHVTVGLAKLDFLANVEGRPLEPFAFHLSGFAVLHLGKNGTAQRELKTWNLSEGGDRR